jgi:hypothetical protein
LSRTVGPWHLDRDTWTIEDNAHNPRQIAAVSPRPERESNARLIEAAPRLLEACKRSLVLLTSRLDLADIADEEKWHRDELQALITTLEGV